MALSCSFRFGYKQLREFTVVWTPSVSSVGQRPKHAQITVAERSFLSKARPCLARANCPTRGTPRLNTPHTGLITCSNKAATRKHTHTHNTHTHIIHVNIYIYIYSIYIYIHIYIYSIYIYSIYIYIYIYIYCIYIYTYIVYMYIYSIYIYVRIVDILIYIVQNSTINKRQFSKWKDRGPARIFDHFSGTSTEAMPKNPVDFQFHQA